MISTVKPVKFDTNAMVNFKPAVLSLNIKQVIMANRGLKSDKKTRGMRFFLSYSSDRSQNLS